MSKTININRWNTIRIAIGMMMLLSLMVEGTSATPINDCATISSPGSYVLTKDIGNSANSVFCISITSSDVVLDGAGYKINGTDAASIYGIYVYNQKTILSNITLKNLRIKEWKVGINYSNMQNGFIVNNNISGNFGSFRNCYEHYGISLSSSRNNMLSGNNISNNCYGIYLDSSDNNALSGNSVNNALDNNYGIYLSSSNGNTLSGNTMSGNHGLYTYGDGITLYSSSSNNTLNGNSVSKYGFGILLSTSSDNKLNGNGVLRNGIGIGLEGANNNTLSGNDASNNDGDGISLKSANNNAFGWNDVSNNVGNGINLEGSTNNTISWNNLSNNYYGFSMYNGNSNNTFNGNSVSNSYYYGISMSNAMFQSSPSNNTIFDNIFNNTNNFHATLTINTWNITRRPGTNIVGGPYIGGNVWAYPSGTGYSQTCNDADSDGICDSSRTLDESNVDYLPLVYRTQSVIPTPGPTSSGTKGDINGDGKVTIVDALFIAQYTVGTRTLTPEQLSAADVNGDGSVSIVDALFIAQYTVGTRTL